MVRKEVEVVHSEITAKGNSESTVSNEQLEFQKSTVRNLIMSTVRLGIPLEDGHGAFLPKPIPQDLMISADMIPTRSCSRFTEPNQSREVEVPLAAQHTIQRYET